MIADLKPYPKYKESGLLWLGRVPAHWSITRIKTMLRELDCRSTSGEGTLLSLTRVRGLIPHTERTDKVHSAKTLVGYKRYQPGEIVMNRMQAWSGMFGAGTIPGIVSPDYAVFTILGDHQTKFVLERLKSPDLVGQFAIESKGIGSGFNRLYTDCFGPIAITLPPPSEQTAILRFLDLTNGRLGRTIRAKRKVIALLNEQKQAIIHRAVTRGLDPDVRLKHSGVEWFGAVPEHWEMMPLKRAFLSMDYGISESSSDTGAIPMLTMGHLKDGRVTVPPSGGVNSVDSSLLLKAGDLLFNRTNSPALVGKVGLFTGYDSPVTFASYLVRMRPHLHHEPEYLNTVLNDALFLSAARSEAIPSLHQSNLNPTRYGRLHLVLPPQSEQRQIFQALEQETADIVGGINVAQNEISLLREYRTRLIADVVTGKLDVREAAARLPDEGEAAEEALDDAVLAESDEDIDASAAEVDPEDVAA